MNPDLCQSDFDSASRSKKIWLIAFFFLIGCAAALYLHWPAVTHYAIYKSDVRQAPQWAAYHTDTFRDDDIFIAHGRFYESRLQNMLYFVGTYFVDMVTLSKIFAVLSFGLGCALFFALGGSLFGLRGGFLSASFFTFFPDQFDYSAGGFSKFWMIPLLLCCVFILKKERWAWLLFLFPFAAIAYPISPVLMGMTAAVYIVLLFPSDRAKAKTCFCYLAFASVIAILILLSKYLYPPDFTGHILAKDILLAQPELHRGGLYPILPTPSVQKELYSYVAHPFVFFSSLLYLIVLGRKVAWDRTWTALFIASILGYLAADYFFLRLYVPNRYTRYSMAVLLILWNARNWDLMLAKIPQTWLRYAVILLLFGTAGYLYRDTFKPGKDTIDRRRNEPLCQFISHLPKKVLIAGHPKSMDDIPVMAKRSVLCNYKMAHSWYSIYYKEVQTRTYATFKALYATNPAQVNELFFNYGVTHLVIRKSHYTKKGLRKKHIYVKPYNQFIKNLIHSRNTFLLKSPPKKSIVYEDKFYYVIALPLAP